MKLSHKSSKCAELAKLIDRIASLPNYLEMIHDVMIGSKLLPFKSGKFVSQMSESLL
jgi:hypothetical protein